MSIIVNQNERRRFIRFLFVGLIGYFIDFGLFNILSVFFHVLPVIASVISFTAAVTSNFIWNRFWTYPDSRSKPLIQQLLQFGFINTIGLIIRTPLFAYLERNFPIMIAKINLPHLWFFDPIFLGHNLALAFAVIVVMFWNFYINRYLTYNDVY